MPHRQENPNAEGPAPARREWHLALPGAALAALALYWVLFQTAPLAGDVRRVDLAVMVLRGLAGGELLQEWASGPLPAAVLERLVLLGSAAAILAGAIALGWLIVRALRIPDLSRLESLVFAAAVGLNVVSTWVLLVGLAGGLRLRWLLAAPLVLAAVVLKLWPVSRPSHDVGGVGKPAPNAPAQVPGLNGTEGGFGYRWLWLGLPLAVSLLAAAMLPPRDFDVREYHLQAPKEFFQQGRISFLPHNVYANMPLGAEMHSLLAMVLLDDWWRGALVGKLLTGAYALLTCLALLAAGRRWFSRGAGVVAALVYLSTPWIFHVAAGGLIDTALAFYLFTAFYALLRWRPGLSGYLAGAAVACKYTGLLYVLAPLALATLAVASKKVSGTIFLKNSQEASRKWFLTPFFVAGLLGCGLWLGKNWVLAGNPTYPLFYSVFGGQTWTPEKDARWNRIHRAHDFSAQALATDAARLAWRSPWQSPIVVPLAAIALLACRRRRAAWLTLAYMAWVLSIWWLVTHRIDRFWLPALPLAALLAGCGACWSEGRLWRWTVAAFLVLAVGYGTLVASSGVIGDNRYLHGLAELRDDPGRVGPWQRFLNHTVGSGRVLVIGEAQVFDFEVPVLYATCFDDLPLVRLAPERTSAQIRADLLAAKVSYIYVDWGEIARYRSPGNYGFTPPVEPGLFDRLVADGVLEPLSSIEKHPGRAYRAVPQSP